MNRFQTLAAGLLMMIAPAAHAALLTTATLDVKARTLTVRPPAGYHFNLEAPAPSLRALTGSGDQELKPARVTASEAVVPLPAGTRSVNARWFVCDDGKALCLVVREELVVEGEKVTARQVAPPAAPARGQPGSEPPPAPGSLQHGFLVDRPEQALAQAGKERRPLLVDFFGIWCPPCNALDETVFSRPEFARSTEVS